MFIKMLKAALQDGVITDDEWKMLKKVDSHYGHYNEEFKDAVSDGFITLDECKKLRKIRNSIYERAFTQAIKDGVITEDERAILDEIKQAADMTDEEIKEIEEAVKKGEKLNLDEGECG